jgi:hypothetical protein
MERSTIHLPGGQGQEEGQDVQLKLEQRNLLH